MLYFAYYLGGIYTLVSPRHDLLSWAGDSPQTGSHFWATWVHSFLAVFLSSTHYRGCFDFVYLNICTRLNCIWHVLRICTWPGMNRGCGVLLNHAFPYHFITAIHIPYPSCRSTAEPEVFDIALDLIKLTSHSHSHVQGGSLRPEPVKRAAADWGSCGGCRQRGDICTVCM